MEEENKNSVPLFNYSFFIVGGLGIAIMILGFLRAWGIEIPATMLMGISISSFIIVFIDYIVFLKPNLSISLMNFIVMITTFLSIIIAICFPYLPLITNLNSNIVNIGSESFSLISFGLTIAVTGVRGVHELKIILQKKNSDYYQILRLLNEKNKELEKYKNI